VKVKGRTKTIYIIISVVFGVYALSLIFPFLYTFLNSFKTNGEFGDNIWAWPKRLVEANDIFRNYRTALNENDLIAMMVRSAILTGVGTFTATLSPAITAYVLAKYRFKLNFPIFTLAVIFMVIPNVEFHGDLDTYLTSVKQTDFNTALTFLSVRRTKLSLWMTSKRKYFTKPL